MKVPKNVTILGAGIVGLSTARFLQRAGIQVTLIDRVDPGNGCSFGNLAMICSIENALPIPSLQVLKSVPRMLFERDGSLVIRPQYLPKLLPWLSRFVHNSLPSRRYKHATALSSLLKESLSAYVDLLGQSDVQAYLKESGSLTVFETTSGFEANGKDRALLRTLGARYDELNQHELMELEPALAPIFSRAVYYHGCAQVVSPLGLCQALATQIREAGGAIVKNEVHHAEVKADGHISLFADDSEFECEALVVAAGAWSAEAAKWFDISVPLETERGYHTTMSGLDIGLDRPITHGETNIGMVQLKEGLRFGGTVELAGLDAPPNYIRGRNIHRMTRRMIKDLPPDDSLEISDWMGCRPTLPDYLPVIGPCPNHSNLWFAFGHQHVGLSLAACTGKLISSLILDSQSKIDLTPYRIDRF